MATHDYVIDNQSAPSLRSDLNNVLQAIVTQNSSATAPATTYANMIWYDTTANQLKKRNEANSAWIVLGTIDEGLGTFTPNFLLTTAGIAPATLVTLAETIAANNNDTTIPTSAAVKGYTDAAVAGISTTWTTLLGTLTTTSGSSQTLSGLTLTPYKFLLLMFNEVSITSTGDMTLNTSLSYRLLYSFSSSGHTINGSVLIDLSTGIFSGSFGPGLGTGAVRAVTGGSSGYTTASTSITLNAATFDAGSVRVYGIR